jgi:formate dehydrogenase maturation protein FdhE
MIALVIGAVLAIGALTFVLYPVFFGVPHRPPAPQATPRASERESAVVALREIEFDRETGKLSDADYAQLKARYTQQAIAAMRREEAAPSAAGMNAVSDAELEAVVRAYREQHAMCPTCGPRPETDAIFCSTCGRYLRDRCAACGAPVDAPDARYCVSCGDRLAA